MVTGLVSDYRVSLRRACNVSLLSTSVWYYKNVRKNDGPLRQRIRNIAETRVRYGIERIVVLLRREGWEDNHKRVYRIYKEEGLDRQSLSINRTDTSISKSKQLEAAVPASKIASLSSGEFVGMVADNPDEKIALKAFHAEILNDHQALKSEEERYKPIPLIRQVDNALVQRNYTQIKQEVQEIVQAEIQRMMNDPELEGLVVRK